MPEREKPNRMIVAMTGASGAPYARTMLRALGEARVETHVTISDGFFEVAKLEEVGFPQSDKVDLREWAGTDGDFHYYHHSKIGAPIASGSFRTCGMIVVPCTSATLGCIASGSGKSLVERAAEVTMKEGRNLALLLRESPLSAIALENALRLSRAGVHIVPTCPAFYVQPKTVQDIVDFTVARALDLFEVDHDLSKRWGEPN